MILSGYYDTMKVKEDEYKEITGLTLDLEKLYEFPETIEELDKLREIFLSGMSICFFRYKKLDIS